MTPYPKLIDKLSSHLPRPGRKLLDATIELASARGLRAFLVGGPVRDLLLDRPSLDLDITVEGDALSLAREVGVSTGARLVKETEFGTAALALDGFVLDLATARSETYTRPGALPKVRPADIDADLLRRDFSVNAIALELTGPAPGKLIDPIGGREDLRLQLVRVLHDRSFQDDATRIIRAVRYEQRFGFRLEERTHDLLLRDLACLDRISGSRVRQELIRTFAELDPAAALLRLDGLGVLTAVHPGLRFGDAQARALRSFWQAPAAMHATCFAVLAWQTPSGQLSDVCRRLALTKSERDAVLSLADLREVTPRLGRGLRPSEIDALLAPFPDAALLALAVAGDGTAAATARLYLTRLCHVRPLLRGTDIQHMGVPEGPRVGEILQRLRIARLDGDLTTRADERAFVRRLLDGA